MVLQVESADACQEVAKAAATTERSQLMPCDAHAVGGVEADLSAITPCSPINLLLSIELNVSCKSDSVPGWTWS